MQQEHTTTDCSTPPQQLVLTQAQQKDLLLHRVIAANEDILKSQCSTITKLRDQLQEAENKCRQAQRQLQIIKQTIPSQEKPIVEQLTSRVAQLEKQLSQQKVKSALREESALTEQFNSLKKIKSMKSFNQIQIGRQNIGSYVNLSNGKNQSSQTNLIDNDLEKSNWVKAIEFYASDYRHDKFRQKTLSYVKKFIPHQLRTKVWPLIFDNRLGITNGLYIELLGRRNQKWTGAKVINQINKDLQRSFCGKTQFQSKTGLSLQVAEVLENFHIYRPDVSYVQGMTYPVIVLVLVVGKIKAFKIFSNIVLANEFYRRLYTFESDFITMYCRVFDMLLKEQNQELASKMEKQKVQSEIFLIQWFFTLCSRGLSFDATLKLWDLFAYYGQIVHYKLALCIFSLIGQRLLDLSYEECIGMIRDYSTHIDQKKLIQLVVSHKLTHEKFQKTIIKVRKNMESK